MVVTVLIFMLQLANWSVAEGPAVF